MKLINRGENNLSHSLIKEFEVEGEKKQEFIPYVLKIGETLDVPEEVAKVWLKFKGIEKVMDRAEIEAEIRKEIEAEVKSKKTKAKKGE